MRERKGYTIISDFTTFNLQYNTGATDAASNFTSTALAFGGTSGANELRFALNGGTQTTTTTSANWPYYTRPGATTAVNDLWAFTADAVGLRIPTYDGTAAHYMQLRWNWDNLGTFAAAPQFGAFGDSTHTTPSAGTQPGTQSGSPIVNGHATDTSSTSYLKANAYGFGVTAAGVQQTPAANAAGTLLVTSGTAGAVSPATAAWLATWQSLQGFTQYILDGAIPQAVTAGQWYWVTALFTGPNMSTGTLLPVVTLQYSYS